MSIKLRELIRNIRACKTKAEERAVVARECAHIRTAFKEGDNQFRHRNVAKLLFIHMMGYPTHFGQMECLKLIASLRFPEKRVGYLGLTLLLDESTEVLMLVTNSIKNDMTNPSQYVNGLALAAVGDIGSAEMCQVLSTSVEQLLGSGSSYVRKKAALAAVRIVRKVDVEGKFNHRMKEMLEERDHGVLISSCNFIANLLTLYPEYIREFKSIVPMLVRALKNMSMSGYTNAAEYDFSGITDPFLQVRILRLLRIFGKGNQDLSDEMNDILAQVVTNTEGSKNAGNAILYEAVMTIMCVEAESGLRVLGINVLGRFLLNRDPNIKYVALTTLKAVVNKDVRAVARHRSTILECLKDTDASIRRRALAVTHALVNEENVKSMTKDLLNFLLVADPEFKDDLVVKICQCVERFSPDQRWKIDTYIKVMCLAGNSVELSTRASFCQVVAAAPDLQAYAVHKLFFSMKENLNQGSQEALVHVGVWCLGEFGDLLVGGNTIGLDERPIVYQPYELFDLVEAVAAQRPTAEEGMARYLATQEIIAMALVKLSVRLPGHRDRVVSMLRKYSSSISVELQQRSCEFVALMDPSWQQTLAGILDKMPAAKPKAELEGAGTGSGGPSYVNGLDDGDRPRGAPAPSAPAPAAAGPDLLDLFDAPAPAAPPSAPAPAAAAVGGDGGVDLMSLFDAGPAAPAPAPAVPAGPPGVTVLDRPGFRVTAQMRLGPDGVSQVMVTFSNSGPTVSALAFEAAVPKYLQMQIHPASSSVVSPNGSATQQMSVRNMSGGEKPVLMKVRLNYEVEGQGRAPEHQGQIEFPK